MLAYLNHRAVHDLSDTIHKQAKGRGFRPFCLIPSRLPLKICYYMTPEA